MVPSWVCDAFGGLGFVMLWGLGVSVGNLFTGPALEGLGDSSRKALSRRD